MKALSSLVLILASATLAHASSATYQGSLNGSPITLTVNIDDQSQISSNFIACQTDEDEPCNGPGQYAFFANSGSSTITYGSATTTSPILLALYLGEKSTSQGKLNGQYQFEDRSGTNRTSSVNFDEAGALENKIQIQISGLTIESATFPASYILNWNNSDPETTSDFQVGSITLVRQ